jgi:hypothetical protein
MVGWGDGRVGQREEDESTGAGQGLDRRRRDGDPQGVEDVAMTGREHTLQRRASRQRDIAVDGVGVRTEAGSALDHRRQREAVTQARHVECARDRCDQNAQRRLLNAEKSGPAEGRAQKPGSSKHPDGAQGAQSRPAPVG